MSIVYCLLALVAECGVGSGQSAVGNDTQRPAVPADRSWRRRQVQDVETDSSGKHEATRRHVRGTVTTAAGARRALSGLPRWSKPPLTSKLSIADFFGSTHTFALSSSRLLMRFLIILNVAFL